MPRDENIASSIQQNGVSIVVPVYDEQDAIAATIQAITTALTETDIPFEIIVVNDGSTDKTSQVLKELQGHNSHLIVLDHEENLGYGAALKHGISRSVSERVLIIDADQTYPADEIPKLIRLADDFDMVVGSRVGSEAKIPLIRRPAKFILTWLAELLSNRRIPDLNSGFRIFKKEMALKNYHILPNGFSFTSTLTLLALHWGFSIYFLPISYYKRQGRSKIRPISDTLNFLQLILRTILYVNPLQIFMPAAIFFFSFSIILFLIRVVSGGGYLVTIILFFICGFELLVIGLLADLIDKRLR